MDGILEEARFYGLENLVKQLDSMTSVYVDPDQAPLTRQDVIKALIQVN